MSYDVNCVCVCVCRTDVHSVVGDDVFVVVEAVLDVLPVLPPLKELLQRTRVEQRSGDPRGRTTETQQKHTQSGLFNRRDSAGDNSFQS